MEHHWLKSLLFTLVCLLALASTVTAQGPLTPPGAPGPTMKTLQQVEPRTPIGSLPFTINTPGSYYVTTNLTGTGGSSGITINSDDVTLDLCGFALIGVAGSLGGISMPATRHRITIRNGIIKEWGGHGVNGSAKYFCDKQSSRGRYRYTPARFHGDQPASHRDKYRTAGGKPSPVAGRGLYGDRFCLGRHHRGYGSRDQN